MCPPFLQLFYVLETLDYAHEDLANTTEHEEASVQWVAELESLAKKNTEVGDILDLLAYIHVRVPAG